MRILVDADACPVRQIIHEEAFKRDIPVIMVVSLRQSLEEREGVQVIRVDEGFQAVDMAIINRTTIEDIVVTSDYGLATLVLGQGGRAISPSGKIFQSDKMDQLLEKRHVASRLRRGGGRMKGPQARNREDDHRFRDKFICLIENSEQLREQDGQQDTPY